MGFFDFLFGVGAILGQIASFISYLFALLWNALVAVFQFLWNVLVGEHNFNNSMFGRTGQLFKDIYKKYLTVAVLGIIAKIKRLYDHLKNIVETIKNIIEAWHDIFEKYFYPWFRLALDILSRIRTALLLFSLMGFAWAKKLDADLAKLQAFITTILQDIVSGLNSVRDVLDIAIDPTMVLRRDFFAHTLFSSLAGLRRAVSFGADRPLTPDEQHRLDQDKDAVLNSRGPVYAAENGTATLHPAFAVIDARLTQKYASEGLPIISP
jgi:hypothetical protein